eukprot:UN05857
MNDTYSNELGTNHERIQMKSSLWQFMIDNNSFFMDVLTHKHEHHIVNIFK